MKNSVPHTAYSRKPLAVSRKLAFISERSEATKPSSRGGDGFITELARGQSYRAKRNWFISERSEETKSLSAAKGFTLIELLLYLGIAGLLITAVSAFVYLALQARARAQVTAEVEQQGTLVMQTISQAVRNAQTVNFPNQGDTDVYLEIKVPAPNDLTVFDLSSGSIRIKEGAGAATPLTSSRVAASSLTFRNLSKSIRIQFTLSYASTSLQATYSFSKTFYGSAMVRTP